MNIYHRVSQTFLLADPFLLRKMTKASHILADANRECPDDRYPKLKTFISELILDRYQNLNNSIRNKTLHDLTLIEINVASLVGIGGFLTRYSKGHTKQTQRHLKKSRDYFNKTLLL